jgi:hypothetical protein
MATEFEVMARLLGDSSSAVSAFTSASGAAQQFQGQVDKTNGMLVALGAGFATAGYSVIKFAKHAFDEAARVAELDVAITAIGRSTGVGAAQLRQAAKDIKAMGIETASAQKMAIEFAQGNLDLAQASKIARVAQDLAVISQKNSTDTAMLLTRAVKTGNSMLLKSAGVSRQASEAYATYAQELGKSQTALTAQERQQAIVNLIMDEGKKVAGVYEAAMMEAGKVLRSFPRIMSNIRDTFGSALLDGFGPAIKAVYDLVKNFDKAIAEGGKFHGVIEALAIFMEQLISPFTQVIGNLADFVKNASAGEINVMGLTERFTEIIPVITALATGLSTLAGQSLLGNVPVIGKFISAFNPLMVGFAVLTMMTPTLRDKLFALGNQLKNLIPPLIGIARMVIEAGAQFINEFIVPIVGWMLDKLGPAIQGVADVLSSFSGNTETASNMVEALKTALVILTGTYVGLKTVQLIQLGITKAQAIWDGILTVATFLLIVATDGLAAAFAALGIAMTASGIGAIIVVIGLIIGAMVIWYQKSAWFRNLIKQILEAIANFFIMMANGIIRTINLIIESTAAWINGFIKVYNWIAKVTGLPKIDPIDPWTIPTINHLNIALEETANKAYGATEAFRKFANAVKAESRARQDSIGWLDRWNDSAKKQYDENESAGGGVDKLKQKIEDLKKETLDYVKSALERAQSALQDARNAMEEYAQSVSDTIYGMMSFGEAMSTVKSYAEEQNKVIEEQRKALDDYSKGISKAIFGVMSLSKAYDDQLKNADEMTKAREDMAKAEDKFNNAQSIKEMIDAQISYEEALGRANKANSEQLTFIQRLQQQAAQAVKFADRIKTLASLGISQAALDQVVAAGAVAGSAIAEEIISGGQGAIDETNNLFKQIADAGETTGQETAKRFYTVGEAMGMDFMAALQAQAEKAKLFADRVRQLAEMGLSKEAIAQVLAAGADAGIEIADYLIAGGETTILESTALLDSVKAVADDLGLLLANKFYQTGVDLASQIVAGLQSKMAEIQKLLKSVNTLEGAKAALATSKSGTDAITATGTSLLPKTIIPRFASGGIVTKPVLGMIGESGAEAVIPLSQMGNMGLGNSSSSINLTVNAGMGSNGSQIGQEIVDALVKWERRNGRVPIRTGV